MDNIQNIQNLDSIIFYSGDNSVVAAEYTESRAFGSTVSGLGTLTKDNDNSTYFSEYPNVRYKERTVNFSNINDLYKETLSYVMLDHNDNKLLGYTYIANNRYNVIYTYETDLQNDFNTARTLVKDNLEEFLIGLNNQTFNKQNMYNNNYEVSSIKIDQTYFKWYPENTIAYYNTISTETAYTYSYYFVNDINIDVYVGETDEILATYLASRGGLQDNEYVHAYSYNGVIVTYEDIPYKIGGNYYSYVRQSYATIDYKLAEKIDEKLTDFENRYNNDHNIYAYYMYDCNSDVNMLLTTLNLGVKESTFKINFDSRFNNWFGNIINIKANVNAGDEIAKITSYADGEIFAIFRNKIDRVCGDNVTLNENVTHTFATSENISIEDTINILTPYSIDTLDLSPLKTKISNVLDLTESKWNEYKDNLRSLILDDGDNSTKSNIEKIFGLNELSKLEYLDISNINFTRTPAIDYLNTLKVFKATNSNIDSFRPKKGITLYEVDLPETVKSIKLVDNKFETGTLTVAGEEIEFTKGFNYIPNDNLVNLTLRNIDDELSYSLVMDWYESIKNANKLDSVIYLELQNINWRNIPIQNLIDIKHFDINPNLSGEVSVIGSGNYKYLTRSEYQNIIKLYGVNAFVKGNDVNNKVFKNLNILSNNKKETFEFDLSILNKTAEEYNNEHHDDYEVILYEKKLPVSFKAYYYDSNFNTEEELPSPYSNRAANALLDIIYGQTPSPSFKFIKDDVDPFAYCKLGYSIDTSSSNEVKSIKAGDILLFNGDTLIIFFENIENSVYEYIKLGHITDVIVEDINGKPLSSIANWFNYENTDGVELQFIPSVRKPVIDDITISINNSIITEYSEHPILTVTLPEETIANIAQNKIENPNIIVTIGSSHLHAEKIDNDLIQYELIPDPEYDFNLTERVVVYVYAEANREDTEVSLTVTLKSDFEIEIDGSTLIFTDENTYVDGTTLVISNSYDTDYDENTNTLIIG